MSFDTGSTQRCDHTDYAGYYWGAINEISACPKCHGTETYYDFTFDNSTGNAKRIIDTNLLEELTIKAILTIKGDNIFHTSFGTSIGSSIGNQSNLETVSRIIETEVEQALGLLYLRQRQQLQLGQVMSADELIYRIDQIVSRVIDPRSLYVNVTVVAESGKDIEIIF